MRRSRVYRDLDLSEFQSMIMTGNICSGFLDMRCVFEDERVEIFYDTGGYRSLDEVMAGGFARATDILELCVVFLRTVSLCADHMIEEKDLSFEDEDIFCSSELSRIRFRYIPDCENHITVREKLVMIAETAMDYYGDQEGVVELMSEYKKRLYARKYSLSELIGITESCARSSRRTVTAVHEDANAFAPEHEGADRRGMDLMKMKVEQRVVEKFGSFFKNLLT